LRYIVSERRSGANSPNHRKENIMLRQSTANSYPYQLGEAARAASRQVWLAGLGATVVTRDWVQGEASHVFKTLVKQGAAVESRAIRFVGDQIETSVTRANVAWKHTRRTVESTVKRAATTAVNLAQQVLPRSLPKIELPKSISRSAKPAAPARRAKKQSNVRVVKAAKAVKRTTKRG
jgi:poly(hydroxyalkanoate) granule associated protein phasin